MFEKKNKTNEYNKKKFIKIIYVDINKMQLLLRKKNYEVCLFQHH